jgi:hypothetical protein
MAATKVIEPKPSTFSTFPVQKISKTAFQGKINLHEKSVDLFIASCFIASIWFMLKCLQPLQKIIQSQIKSTIFWAIFQEVFQETLKPLIS